MAMNYINIMLLKNYIPFPFKLLNFINCNPNFLISLLPVNLSFFNLFSKLIPTRSIFLYL